MLMRRLPDEMRAGEIAAVQGLKPSTCSTYLAALIESGLIAQRRDGTSLFYRIDLDAVQGLMNFLFTDCCNGRPDLCPPGFLSEDRTVIDDSEEKLRVLFICTGNSARSIMAEALLQDVKRDSFDVFSAGTDPKEAPHPLALDLLRNLGHRTQELKAKSLDDLRNEAPMDVVITVCDQVANADGPIWTGRIATTHWSTPDPMSDTAERGAAQAFRHAYATLNTKIRAFAALKLNKMDPVALQRALDEIGTD